MKTTRTVLCVEDDRNDAFLLSVAFEEAGHLDDLHIVCRGSEAMDYLSGKSKFADRHTFPLPDLILLDLKLPDVSGHELLEWIRAQPKHHGRVVIVFSASDHPDDISEAYARGVNSYACKPLTLEKTMEFVRLLYGYWFEWNHFAPETADDGTGKSSHKWTCERGESPVDPLGD